ncbi:MULTISPECIES: FadR/GntR family transcriptional regulator [Paenarthrobacter]|jgi:DNA-binding FadR family transcriptional regulator|uniref:FadR/GntR family transcriptional regulator n=1 Tax=Paenarthrobacter TaxID=1742992 RepID=UPI00140E61D6|nr:MULTISPECIES: FadR/GntR family transcriptional regulator [Paenarthrobacter]MCW3767400.1 FadR family transcriptional regulator [Paenarthrobacter sp. PAE-2]MCX8456200.1 FadR/GntR family transcriptional regulator [Paenarthrobacter ureafaciens]MCY0975005.1 FadR/GntR family transcriptional regulator [Paenarthrobacter ureafaciens]QOT18648.1 FadR family transcriptional regulator [Paenarthrobacter sp. YJN-5]QQQ62498.1 FadR family transcriptional regulator [Paenarthrobacter ureafaciens]
MARKSLVGVVADELLDRIVAGEFPPGTVVPGELELSARHEVSRMTVREAMKTLEAQKILSVERGRGTFVNPLNQWTSLEAVLRAASEGTKDAAAAIQLIELRRMLETGACELAAGRISDEDLAVLKDHVEQMQSAHEINDVAAFVEADLAFHDVILHASGNVFVAVLFEPLHRVLEARRTQTSAVPEIQEHAIKHHRSITTALESRNANDARLAMDEHMQQTLDDLKTYVLEA